MKSVLLIFSLLIGGQAFAAASLCDGLTKSECAAYKKMWTDVDSECKKDPESCEAPSTTTSSTTDDCGLENANGQFYCNSLGVMCTWNLNNQLHCNQNFCNEDHGTFTCPMGSSTLTCSFSNERLSCSSN